ncbi:a67df824-cbe3-47f5-a1c1-ad67fc52839f [Thermothielavioides terrestris]|nr:a67df824-cbe3-47f5-a1c1-ad67fc52839f [Thermothielavioides terrestris]
MHASLKVVYDAMAIGDIDGLRTHLLKSIQNDANTATRMLEKIPEARKQAKVPSAESELCDLYLESCAVSLAPEVRAQALLNLGSLIDEILSRDDITRLPSDERLDQLWREIRKGDMNPTLSHAIIETSGSIMAVFVSRDSDKLDNMEWRVRSWGDMLSDCLDVDNPFDTRYAAAVALRSFFSGARRLSLDSKYLPVLSALYDGLIDDDEEVREAAASAASALTGAAAVAPAAADGLVGWLRERFGESEEFRARLVCRMVGQAYTLPGPLQLVPAEKQLCKALDFDDSLFAAEEQNLFIDEVRETARWRRAFADLRHSGEDQSFGCLKSWVEEGLNCLIGLAQEEDGPLGWTSNQHVFAVCARVLLSAVAITGIGQDEGAVIVELLRKFREVGEKCRIHGSLLSMARLVSVAYKMP